MADVLADGDGGQLKAAQSQWMTATAMGCQRHNERCQQRVKAEK